MYVSPTAAPRSPCDDAPGATVLGATPAPGPATSPALDSLASSVEAYLTSDEPRSEAETAGDLLAIGVVIERLEAARVGLLGDLDRSGAYLADGAVSPAAWLRARADGPRRRPRPDGARQEPPGDAGDRRGLRRR